jgi:hypothetical protein
VVWICVIVTKGSGGDEVVQHGNGLLAIIGRMGLENKASEKGASQCEGGFIRGCRERLAQAFDDLI